MSCALPLLSDASSQMLQLSALLSLLALVAAQRKASILRFLPSEGLDCIGRARLLDY